MGFARILAHYPYVVLLVVLVVTATCLVVSITIPRPLDFSQPTLGFEPRGTEIGKRLRTYQSMLDNIDKTLNLQPFHGDDTGVVGAKAGRGRSFDVGLDAVVSGSGDGDGERSRGDDAISIAAATAAREHIPLWKDTEMNYFCGLPHKDYVRVVYKSADGSSLLSAKKLQILCQLEEEYYDSFTGYTANCELRQQEDRRCCRRLSLPNYIAFLAKKSSCHNITDGDIGDLYRRLSSCAGYYHNLTLGPACGKLPKQRVWYGGFQDQQESCPGVPSRCTKWNLVYHVLHYLVDHDFLNRPVVPKTNPPLTYVATFLPVAASESNIQLYEHLERLPRAYRGVEVAGAHFSVKHKLFEQYLVGDSVWLGMAGAFIFLAMWLYTTSIFVTFMTFLSIFWALVTAYFLYTYVFEISFFPYMNMIAVVIMIGIGTDDLFVYCKVWHLAKSEKNNGVLEKVICDTLRHTVLSMLVTSLTTAAAFIANYISDISAIRCFSIYAGTSVICNFVLTITWVPASFMLYEKWCNFYMCQQAEVYTGEFSICYWICKVPYKLYYLISDWSRVFFEQILPCLVIKLRYVWLFLYGCLGICAVVVIFYYPRLRLPSSKKFQVFKSDHLLEQYDFHLSNVFGFEMTNEEDTPSFPITIVWGVHPTDYGDYLNPRDRGPLAYDQEFDMTTAASQSWILDFCRRLRRADFYQPTHGMQLTNCFLENFVKRFMKQPCSNKIANQICCNNTVFPYRKEVFMECLNHYMEVLPRSVGAFYSQHTPGPRFNDGHVTALIVQFQTSVRYSHSYQQVQSFYRRVNRWVTEEMLKAPKEMRYGWFVSYLDFYDLQHSLVSGTPLAIGVSLAVVALVTFFTTLNALVSLYALVTIACIIMVTLASLVLLGWELNILESVVITVAIGMSIDYTLHYAVAYRLAPDLDREMRVASSIGRMGSPVAMAALTTMAAGAFLMPSTVLVYHKFGTFLMLLVSVGWLYSTFFFQSLLRLMGPQGGFGQFHWPALDCCGPSSRERVDKTIYAFSESTLSSSSANHASTETHELEPLTDLHDSSPRLISHHPVHHCAAHHYTHHHHHHHHHRPRSRGQYIQVRTDLDESRCLNSSNGGSKDQRAAVSAAVPKREPVVSFESPKKRVEKERNASERTCSVSEADSGVALAQSDQSPTCVPFDAHTPPAQQTTQCAQSAVVTPPLRPVSASDLSVSSHEGFPQAVQVL